jgi:geranylgeranyl pyrophosphate synthase
MVNLSFGQAIDIAWHKGLSPANEVTEEQYLQMCSYKTGTLARLAAKMAAVLAATDEKTIEKIGKFAESVGIAFQIQDDILDLVGKEFAEGKGGVGMDITEGKLTLIVIRTLQEASSADKKELTRILSMHTANKVLKRRAIRIFEKYNSIEYAKKYAANIVSESWDEAKKFFTQSEAKKTLKALVDYLIKRSI